MVVGRTERLSSTNNGTRQYGGYRWVGRECERNEHVVSYRAWLTAILYCIMRCKNGQGNVTRKKRIENALKLCLQLPELMLLANNRNEELQEYKELVFVMTEVTQSRKSGKLVAPCKQAETWSGTEVYEWKITRRIEEWGTLMSS